MRNIKINKVLNGFRVKVGCQEVVFEDKEKLLAELSRYIDDPVSVEDEYLAKYKSVQHPPAYVVMNSEETKGTLC